MRLTAEMSVVCLSVCLSTYVRPGKKMRVHVGNQLCPDPGVRVSPRVSLMLSCVGDQLCPDPTVRVSPR